MRLLLSCGTLWIFVHVYELQVRKIGFIELLFLWSRDEIVVLWRSCKKGRGYNDCCNIYSRHTRFLTNLQHIAVSFVFTSIFFLKIGSAYKYEQLLLIIPGI